MPSDHDGERCVDRETWLEERRSLLEKEKAFTRAREDLAAERRGLPLLHIDKPYAFNTVRGDESLADLFKGRGQLIIFHAMFGADWDAACPSCSFWLDNFSGIDVHLAARDTNLVACSTAPLDKITAYKERMDWRIDWASSGRSDFNADFGVTFKDGAPSPTGGYNYTDKVFGEEAPGLSVFKRLADGGVGHAYSTYARGLDVLNGAYHLLDLTPRGRNEAGLSYPQAWVRRRDEYESAVLPEHAP